MKDVTQGMPDACAYCAKTHEKDGGPIDLRPYGKDGAWICYDCGMKPQNRGTTDKMFSGVLNSNTMVVTGDRKDKRKLN
jgi:hypothetical protein